MTDEELYLKIAMLDCHTCTTYNTKCRPEDNVFKCHYPVKTTGLEDYDQTKI